RRDLLGSAQTGTGKTAAFALPVLQMLTERRTAPVAKAVRALVLAPTRELAAQIDESFRVYGRYLKITRALVYGGVHARNQIRALRRGVDILVATPGRLLDLLQQGCLRLDQVEILVLDEADRMLDMGFLPDVRKIHSAIPSHRQSMLFSATLPEEIRRLTRTFLRNPVRVSVSPPSSTVENIEQRVLFVDRENKKALLQSVLQDAEAERVLVFTRTKHGADKIAKSLNRVRVRTEAIHGNKSQPARLQALEKFRSGQARVLVATDLASRGLDVDGITHVINYELPNEAESYVHRIGRTARAGAGGVAISFCDAGERSFLGKIEKEIDKVLNIDTTHSFHSPNAAASNGRQKGKRGRNGTGGRTNGKTSGGPFSGKAPASTREWSPRASRSAGRKMTFRPR
ncbi:MAG: DEAD/DEAH box helicase, partial [Nitrospinaceae bacterium]|nr:DEAD/DEAH box helicase [Nitrospinaceae bacterium]NIR57129.1 DEAD/DEAH box helicase [Nitrospinaceae bacterium]NIS87570.1 DEAD/DEAH box helicase [Nitrospinaceae bacterium]NIT84440.1 DEAD/DEAH box helicase [Nitrospinaceae bacterium]NIU46627.1 DEAD/DEAH box helicase [Nitrospinaceae bacterium]